MALALCEISCFVSRRDHFKLYQSSVPVLVHEASALCKVCHNQIIPVKAQLSVSLYQYVCISLRRRPKRAKLSIAGYSLPMTLNDPMAICFRCHFLAYFAMGVSAKHYLLISMHCVAFRAVLLVRNVGIS